jgi:glycerophosphoryl diester phosphodiesterase
LVRAKWVEPVVPCWFTTERGARLGADAIKAAGGDGWFCSLDRANANAVRAARTRGLAFGVWTVNETADMRALIALGADAICTDRPDRLQALLD